MNTHQINIGFLGDIFVGDEKCVSVVDRELSKSLRSNTVNIANLEGPVVSEGNPIQKSGAALRQSDSAIDLLHALNVNVVGLANNHMSDYGMKGICHTLEKLDSVKIKHTGAGVSFASTYSPWRIVRDDLKVTIFAAAENGFGCLSNEHITDWGYAWIFHPFLQSMIVDAVNESDFVVLYAHAGVEHMARPLPQWRLAYRRFIDMGVSAVIAHHPHISQGTEFYRNAPIIYSLGNTFFTHYWNSEHWYHSQFATLTFRKNCPVLLNMQFLKFDIGNANRILFDHSEWGEERCSILSNELMSGMYNTQLIDDLNALWTTKYQKYLENGLSSANGFKSALKCITNRLRQYRNTNKWLNPTLLLALIEIESHRWFYSSYMQMQAKVPFADLSTKSNPYASGNVERTRKTDV